VEASLADTNTGTALLIRLDGQPEARLLELTPRRTAHVRHWHKYVQGKLQPWLRFNFRGRDGRGTPSAANVQEFCDLLSESSLDVVAFHAERGDFSRWVDQALQELELSSAIRLIETHYIASRRSAGDIAALRHGIVKAIMEHYG
jgi:hypothetical protein